MKHSVVNVMSNDTVSNDMAPRYNNVSCDYFVNHYVISQVFDLVILLVKKSWRIINGSALQWLKRSIKHLQKNVSYKLI